MQRDIHAPRPRRASSRAWWLLVLVLVAGRIAVVPITLHQAAVQGPRKVLTGDVRRFHAIATHPGTPYQSFEVEYPPVMLGAVKVLDSGSFAGATAATMWSQLLMDLGVALLLWWGWGKRSAVAYLIIGAPFLFYPFLYLRLDLLSVLLAVGGIALVRRRRPALGGAALALACFAKVWPVLLAPALLIRRSWRAVASFCAVGAIGLAAWVGWVGTAGLNQVLSMRHSSGWEVESLVGAIGRLFSADPVRLNQGAWRFGTVPHWAYGTMNVLLLATVAAAWLLARRHQPHGTAVLDGTAAIAAVGAFLLFSPLLSPQFMIWIVPFAAIAAARGDRLVGGLVLAIVAISVADLNLVTELVKTNAVLPQGIVLVRNLLLVVLVGVCFARLVRQARRPAVAEAPPELVEAAA
jgi:Glycosyltransferase family 87